ncbi:MAG: ABC transporter permease [Myxococcus sp.]|nr:ABC transporter permease [Myxococcus sp.]
MLTTMAWRNLWRNTRRTLITASSIAFGLMMAILFTALSDGQWGRAIDDAARVGPGHITIQHHEFQETPSLQRTVDASEALLAKVRAKPGVLAVEPRIAGQAMLATAHDSFSAAFVALDPARETKDTFTPLSQLVAGALFEADDDQGVVLGEKLAENLNVKLGQKVVFTLTDSKGEIVSGLARVRGLVRTGAPSADASLCLLPLAAVRKLIGYTPTQTTQVAILVEDQRRSQAMADTLSAGLPEGTVALNWTEVNPDLSSMVNIKVIGGQVLEAFVIMLIAAGIFNTIFMSVMERMREFGILMAIGFSPGRLFRLVVLESFWLAVVGLVVGAAITAPLHAYLHAHGIDVSAQMGSAGGMELGGVAFNPIIPVGIYPDHAVVIVLLIAGVTLLAGLFPAWRASRVQPVEAIKLT